jgi:hydrogenase/urease accessory protein HupE
MLRKVLLFLFFISPVSQLFAHVISEADKASMLSGGYLEYIRLGAVHMVTGYDHLLFLLGVIFFLTKFKDILKFITAFTVGHSITLIFATVFNISANYFLVDAVIALSVCYKGFENIDGFKKYLNIKSPNLVFVVFLFGLVHGFGLSTRLQQLPLGDHGLIMRILSFNLGVEVGQIIALFAMVILISSWRKTSFFSKFSSLTNCGLIVAGFLLFIMQIHGYLHTVNPDDFGFGQDNHQHAHEEMNSDKEFEQVFIEDKSHDHGSGRHVH